MELQRLKELIGYSPQTGALTLNRSGRLLTPDDFGFIVVFDPETKKRSKLKADRISYEIGNDKPLPDNHRILHKNLDDSDCRLQNLTAVSRSVYNKVHEALKNLQGHLKILPHPDDQYSYVITYKEGGVERKEVKYDIVSARQRYLTIQLGFAKVLNKYCIFDN